MRHWAPVPALMLFLSLAVTGCGHAGARGATNDSGAAPVVRTNLPALPPPDRTAAPLGAFTGPVPGAFDSFASYAMANAGKPPPGKLRESALIDQSSLAAAPRRSRCREQKPAVLFDLDPGAAAYDLDDPPSPAAGLAASLARLRVSGIRVLWITGLPQDAEPDLRRVLRATELDPDGSDTILLRRAGAERKQIVRLAAARDWCILAIAGDTRSDFDEVFDYLRDLDGPVARALEGNLGAGWFLTPLPIG